LLTQGKDDNEAGRKKDKQETANLNDREYKGVLIWTPLTAVRVCLIAQAPSPTCAL
jgi:hypothetical protein